MSRFYSQMRVKKTVATIYSVFFWVRSGLLPSMESKKMPHSLPRSHRLPNRRNSSQQRDFAAYLGHAQMMQMFLKLQMLWLRQPPSSYLMTNEDIVVIFARTKCHKGTVRQPVNDWFW